MARSAAKNLMTCSVLELKAAVTCDSPDHAENWPPYRFPREILVSFLAAAAADTADGHPYRDEAETTKGRYGQCCHCDGVMEARAVEIDRVVRLVMPLDTITGEGEICGSIICETGHCSRFDSVPSARRFEQRLLSLVERNDTASYIKPNICDRS